jgi:nickel superoxide dismutase
LTRHHAVILAAMQAKQNADLKYATALTAAIARLVDYYPEHSH